LSSTALLVGAVSTLAVAGVIVRPFRSPEALWPIAGALLLMGLGLLPPADALRAILKGTDVYLFLTGMLLLSETARQEGLFDWLAAYAARHAAGSASRLFLLTYAVGTLVTVFLSNDATAVVLTPAVAAVMRTARVERPLPFLLICAFIANAASFVLPISNPANLVVYGRFMPSLGQWLAKYGLPSLLAIGATYVALRLTQRRHLTQRVATEISVPHLSGAAVVAAFGIACTGAVLLVASGMGVRLGAPTCAAGLLTTLLVLLCERKTPWHTIGEVSWGVIPLVAGLFMLVQALDHAGLISALSQLHWTAWAGGIGTAAVCNLVNNLPAGLVVGNVIQHAQPPDIVARSLLIGVDLGPNLSVTGSLATLLWLSALRREGIRIDAGRFLRVGLLVMPPALLLALTASMLLN
jgi:arsenical pump membrane protein